MSERVKEILSWYRSENAGTLSNLYRIMSSGLLAGTGKMLILPVDQGFEHGPARSFAVNPQAYDPRYHIELALEAGCSAYAAPYGQLAAVAADYAGRIPLIVKVNNSDSLFQSVNPEPAITCSVSDALALGASAIGFTIYPGSSARNEMYQQIVEMAEEARACGLAVVIWSYPRGEGLSKDGETALDVVAYAAHIAAQLGAHIIKVKPPTAKLEQESAKKVYQSTGVQLETLEQRISHVVNASFAGRRIVVFSGGEAKQESDILEEVKAIHRGGGFGSIIGRNSFQRKREEGVELLKKIAQVYKS